MSFFKIFFSGFLGERKERKRDKRNLVFWEGKNTIFAPAHEQYVRLMGFFDRKGRRYQR